MPEMLSHSAIYTFFVESRHSPSETESGGDPLHPPGPPGGFLPPGAQGQTPGDPWALRAFSLRSDGVPSIVTRKPA